MNKQIIRNWSQSDIPALAKYLNNKKIWDNCRDSLPCPYTEEDAARFIESTKCQNGQHNYCIEVNGEAAGNISFIRYANNPASMKVLEKNGFRKCGIHEKACFKNGEFIDCHYFELLK